MTTSFKRKNLFQLTWPIFVEMTLFMLMGMADTFMLSGYSDNAVAAVGMSNQVINLIAVMFNFVAAGTVILISQNLGAKNYEKASEYSLVSIAANLAIGICLSIVLVSTSKHILVAMNTPADIFDTTVTYTRIVGSFLFFLALQPVLSGILRSFGFTKHSMIIALVANLCNIVGNAIFIYGLFGAPEIGPVGVAISTVLSRFISVALISCVLYRKISFSFSANFFKRLPVTEIKNILRIGVPSALEHVAYSTSQTMILSFISMLGTLAVTTRVYGSNIGMLIYLFGCAVAQGNQILVGYLMGEKQTDEVYHRTVKSHYLALSVTVTLSILVYIFSDQVFGLFTQDIQILKLGKSLMLVNIFLEVGRATNLVLTNALKAAGDINYPFIVGIIGMWGISVPFAYILGIHFELGLIGVWIAFAADECFRGIIFLVRWHRKKWENKSFIS